MLTMISNLVAEDARDARSDEKAYATFDEERNTLFARIGKDVNNFEMLLSKVIAEAARAIKKKK